MSNDHTNQNIVVLSRAWAPFFVLVVLLHLRLTVSATGSGRLRHRLKSARCGRTDVGWWFKSNKQNQNKKDTRLDVLLFWLSLLDLNQRKILLCENKHVNVLSYTNDHTNQNIVALSQGPSPFFALLVLLHLRLPASATGGGQLRCRLKSAKGGRTHISRWGKADRAKKAKRKSRSFDLLFFLALLVGLEPTTYGLTVRRSTD